MPSQLVSQLLGKLNVSISNDASKWIMAVPRFMMEMTCIWPKRRNIATMVLSIIFFILLICLETGQLVYFALNFKDINKMSSTMSTISTTLQAMTKVAVVVFNFPRLKVLIDILDKEFWPSNLLEPNLVKSLASLSRLIFIGMASVFVAAMIFGIGTCSFPLIDGRRDLPLPSSYPFNWNSSPIYEIVYFSQFFTNCYVSILTVCGHDNLFFVLVANCIAQFKLLREVVMKIGGGEEKLLNEYLYDFTISQNGNRNEDEIKNVLDKEEKDKKIKILGSIIHDDLNLSRFSEATSEEMKLLIKCIHHHNKLLHFCAEIQGIFSPSLFFQLLASVTAICISSFLLTVANVDKDQWYHLSSYCLGHVLQLYLFCAAGNELGFQSKTLSNFAFESNWHLKEYKDVRKGLILMIQRSQREAKLSALGAAVLNNTTFVNVLRMSFSLYTLLSNITKGKNLQ